MAIQSQPSRIPEPFAGSGTKNTIPATNSTPSASQAASWASGFPPECSRPISAGGCPVPRNDVNGALNQLSQDFAFRQDGGIWEWSALADYDAQRVVRGSDGILYWSVQPSGPNVAAGAQDPTLDTAQTYWASPKVPTMPAGDDSQAVATTGFVGAAINIAIPVGTVLWSANPAVPSGYLPCNGAAVGRATYPELFAAIGTTYGSGDGSTTFNLPNLIGKVPWGSTSVGTVLDAGLPNITGKINTNQNALDPYGVFKWSTATGPNFTHNPQSFTGPVDILFDASRSSNIYGNSSTVQPPALCLLPCIRYE